MRVIQGIQSQQVSSGTLEALLQLDFPNLVLYPTHVIEHVGSTFGKYFLTITESEYYAQYMKNEQVKAQNLLENYEILLRQHNVPHFSHLREGHVANELVMQLKEVDGDLLCISQAERDTMGHFFFGSVGRKLISQCQKSILVHKSTLRARSIRRAVFATDHSSSSQQALDRLIRLHPQGLEHIVVLTAIPNNLSTAFAPFINDLGLDVNELVKEKLNRENLRIVERLNQEGYNASPEVRSEPIHEAIAASLEDHQAGLLILAAQGHGMIEPMGLGSVCSYQVLHTHHSVMVIRN